MRAIRVHEYGNPDVLKYEEVPLPDPGPGEVRIKIEAAGVNFTDIYRRQGRYSGEVPFILGGEAAGIIDALGPDVSGCKPGDRVAYALAYALQTGGYAEYGIAPAWKLVPLPTSVSSQLGAAVLLQGMTAHCLCFDTYPLGPEDTALIHAAAGGVGLLMVQLAKRCGAHVIGTVSTEEKAYLAKEAGADEVIVYTEVDFEVETSRLTGGDGVNIVYDSVGEATFAKSLACLKPRGYLVLYGEASGPVPPLRPQVLNTKGSLFLTSPSLRHYIQTREALLQRTNDLFNWLAAGDMNVRIDQVYSLAEAAEAHRYLEGRKSKGKILLIP